MNDINLILKKDDIEFLQKYYTGSQLNALMNVLSYMGFLKEYGLTDPIVVFFTLFLLTDELKSEALQLPINRLFIEKASGIQIKDFDKVLENYESYKRNNTEMILKDILEAGIKELRETESAIAGGTKLMEMLGFKIGINNNLLPQAEKIPEKVEDKKPKKKPKKSSKKSKRKIN